MKKTFKNKRACPPTRRGISVLEILVVVAILGVIFLIVIPQFSKSRESQVLKSAVSDVISSTNKAQSQTLASVNSSSYGVHFQSDKIIIFKGTDFPSRDTTKDETISITSPASISSIALGAGVSDIYFNRLSGTPNKTGTVTITTPSFSKTITISATGSVSSN